MAAPCPCGSGRAAGD
ncbi:SEC-C domain-containing protein [Pseudomonas sp. HN2]|nr:SEC-C domain-containing protein [Pseudomonas sp. HN2]